MKTDIFICQCHSLEHQMFFYYDEDNMELSCQIHLITHKRFLKRLWQGLKYVFGYKSKYGNWDEMIFKPDDCLRLKEFLDKNYSVYTIKR